MTLVKIVDLIDKPVKGVSVDIRSRTADGELMYDHTRESAHRTRLITVKVVRKKDHRGWQDWMRWTWEKRADYPHDCGFSGVVMDGKHEHEYHLLADVPANICRCGEPISADMSECGRCA